MYLSSWCIVMVHELCIIGGGSIGGVISYYGFRGGLTDVIVYYGSRRSVEAVNNSGGLRIIYGGREYHVPVRAYHYMSPAGKCRFIVNTVKAYNLHDTLNLMMEVMDRESLVLLLQNGMGVQEEIIERLGYDRSALGVVFIGATRTKPDTIVHHGGNTIYVGTLYGFNTGLIELADKLSRGGGDVRVVSRIQFYRWLKLGVNAVVNPLTAIARSPNKIVLTGPGRRLAEMIVDEVVEAASRKGVELDRDRLLEIILRAARNTGENYSSMAQDIISGRRTEIDYINGYIAGILGWKSINGVITLVVKLIEEALHKG